jgi:intracellular sulfur oxidation DsrE/DsrF family protein
MISAHDSGEPRHSRRGALGRLGAGLAVAGGIALETPRPLLAQEATPTTDAVVPPDFKVVLHATYEQHWIYVISNLANLLAEWPQAKLRVVVDGSAVYTLQGENKLTDKLAALVEKGVEVQVCPNALREHGIDASTIPAYSRTNLGGVVALVQAHQEGYVYVKP